MSLTLWPSDSESVVSGSGTQSSQRFAHSLWIQRHSCPLLAHAYCHGKGGRRDSHHKLETANVDYVHLVVGTRTRGIPTLFLARLRMTVDKCVSAGKPRYFPIP
jgi:hypothetical protein